MAGSSASPPDRIVPGTCPGPSPIPAARSALSSVGVQSSTSGSVARIQASIRSGLIRSGSDVTSSVCPRQSWIHCFTEPSNTSGALRLTRSPRRPRYTASSSAWTRLTAEPCCTTTPLGRPVEPEV